MTGEHPRPSGGCPSGPPPLGVSGECDARIASCCGAARPPTAVDNPGRFARQPHGTKGLTFGLCSRSPRVTPAGGCIAARLRPTDAKERRQRHRTVDSGGRPLGRYARLCPRPRPTSLMNKFPGSERDWTPQYAAIGAFVVEFEWISWALRHHACIILQMSGLKRWELGEIIFHQRLFTGEPLFACYASLAAECLGSDNGLIEELNKLRTPYQDL
jgi:hypothetical protein